MATNTEGNVLVTGSPERVNIYLKIFFLFIYYILLI